MFVTTLINGVLGGSLIGLASSSLLLGNGDILGASGIIGSILLNPLLAISSENRWKVIFLSSFLFTSNIIGTFLPQDLGERNYLEAESLRGKYISSFGYTISGFLVGFGTRLGNGCTSGHGICGIARLNIRSFVAVFFFMTTAIITTTFILPMTSDYLLTSTKKEEDMVYPRDGLRRFSYTKLVLYCHISCVLLFNRRLREMYTKAKTVGGKKFPVAITAGFLFSAGLALSGMIQQKKIFGFLDMKGIKEGYYDISLIMVMAGGVTISAGGYHFVAGFNYFKNVKTLSRPWVVGNVGGKFNIPTNKMIDAKLLIGSSCFGIGWGIGGLCPGPALFSAACGNSSVLFSWWPSNILGLFLAEYAKQFF